MPFGLCDPERADRQFSRIGRILRLADLNRTGKFMNLAKLTQGQLMKRCAWCHRVMPEDKECFGAGGKVWPSAKALLVGHEGTLMSMRLSTGKEVIVVVPSSDSEARSEGHDLFFQACSEECVQAISDAIRAELPGSN